MFGLLRFIPAAGSSRIAVRIRSHLGPGYSARAGDRTQIIRKFVAQLPLSKKSSHLKAMEYICSLRLIGNSCSRHWKSSMERRLARLEMRPIITFSITVSSLN
jgi:hypothetical protein